MDAPLAVPQAASPPEEREKAGERRAGAYLMAAEGLGRRP